MKPERDDKAKILIVDDEKENLTGFKYLFEDDYDVYTAESAAEGKEILRQQEINVVISDQRMPKTTGVEFLQDVFKDHPNTIRMILTGYSDFDAIIDAINKGKIYYYFSKPWKESEMQMIIENALEAVSLKKELMQSKECFRQLSENVKEVFWIFSTDWKELHYISPTYQKMFGTDEKLLYQNPIGWLDAVHDEDVPQVKLYIDKMKNNLDLELVFPGFRIVRPDKTIRWLSFKTFPVKDQNGKTCRFAGLLEDKTESKQTLETLIQSEKMITMGSLAAGMAHELNNPLAGIINSAQLLKQRLSEDLEPNRVLAKECKLDLPSLQQYIKKRNINETIKNIRSSGLRASRIISDMLSFSRKSDSYRGKANIQIILDNAINLARSDYDIKKKYDFKNIEIIKNIETGLPPIFCNESEIGQVILNLIRNAAQAMVGVDSVERQMIIIRATSAGNSIKIEIEDNGPGMDEAVQKRIFEPFFTTKKKGEGTGLGLSISYKIITTHHNGSISVESNLKKGTTFRILLPFTS